MQAKPQQTDRGITIAEIANLLPTIFDEARTYNIHKGMEELAARHRRNLYGHCCAHPEFLVDYVIYERKLPSGIELAVESELSACAWLSIAHDFDKLMHVKSSRKLLICRPSNWPETKKGLEGYLSRYRDHLRNDEYWVLRYSRARREFWEWKGKRRGLKRTELV